MKTIICEDPWKSNFYKIDTGLGNRLTYWGLAYSLLLKLGRDWNIGIYKEQFPELDYIRLPKTFILDKSIGPLFSKKGLYIIIFYQNKVTLIVKKYC